MAEPAFRTDPPANASKGRPSSGEDQTGTFLPSMMSRRRRYSTVEWLDISPDLCRLFPEWPKLRRSFEQREGV